MYRPNKRKKISARWTIKLALAAVLVNASIALAQGGTADISVLPADLGRLSWGAVIAGAIIALMLQLLLNLLGIGVGVTTVAPDPHETHQSDSSPLADATRMTVIWMAVSTLISLFIGGWIAARFAGIPGGTDGMLHGLLVWGLVMLVTLFLITTTLGRLLSGVGNAIGQAIAMLTRLTGAAAQGAATVAGGAANVAAQGVSAAVQGAAGVAQGAAQAAGSAAVTAVDTARQAAQAAQPTVEEARRDLEQRVQQELDKHPDVKQALDRRSVSRQQIEDEARKLLDQAGVMPERLEAEAENAAREMQDAAGEAVQQVTQDPRQAAETMLAALRRVLDRGTDAVSEVDRKSVIDVIVARTGQTEAQARQTLSQWENRADDARGEFERVRAQAETQVQQFAREAQAKAEQARRDVEHKVDEVRRDVGQKVDEVRRDVDLKAREAAAATTKAISRVALAAFAAMLLGAFAAGFGGAIGAPEALPVAEVELNRVVDPAPVVLTLTATPFEMPTATPAP